MYSTNAYTPSPRRKNINYKYLMYAVVGVIAIWIVISIIKVVLGWLSPNSPAIVGSASLIQGEATVKLKDGIEVKLLPGKDENIFAGEFITTAKDSYITVKAAGGFVMRIGELTVFDIDNSFVTDSDVKSTVNLSQGQLWLDVPKQNLASTVKYSIDVATGRTDSTIKGTKVAFFTDTTQDAIRVFEGVVESGVKDDASKKVSEAVSVGVGQQAIITNQVQKLFSIGQNPSIITAIDDEFKQGGFYKWNASFYKDPINIPVASTSPDSSSLIGLDSGEIMVLTPKEGQKVSQSLLDVTGTFVSGKIVEISVNGKQAVFQNETWKAADVPVTKDGENIFTIEGKNALGTVVYRSQVKVVKDLTPLPAPVVTFPPDEKSMWDKDKLELVGTVAQGTSKVEVNDFVLTKFRTGNTEWKYLANRLAGNMKYGLNTFTVYAIDEAGNKSTPKVTYVYLKKPGEDITKEQAFGGIYSPSQAKNSSGRLNPPIILEPNNGRSFETSEKQITISGIVPDGTQKVQVNELVLKKFKPGDKEFKYYAWVDYNTLKPGKNTYKVYAIDSKGVKSDAVTLEITYTPFVAPKVGGPFPNPTVYTNETER